MSELKQTPLRIPKELHDRLAKESKKKDESMNKVVKKLLEKHLPKL